MTFSSCKEESRADHRGHVGLCGLSAISEPEENNNPQRSLSLCTGFCLRQQDHVHSSTRVPFSPIHRDLLGRFRLRFHQLTS